jgi:hypothetical protein
MHFSLAVRALRAVAAIGDVLERPIDSEKIPKGIEAPGFLFVLFEVELGHPLISNHLIRNYRRGRF